MRAHVAVGFSELGCLYNDGPEIQSPRQSARLPSTSPPTHTNLLPESWNLEMDQHPAHLFPLCQRTASSLGRKRIHWMVALVCDFTSIYLSCVLPIGSQNYDHGHMGEFIHHIRYKSNHDQVGQLSASTEALPTCTESGREIHGLVGKFRQGNHRSFSHNYLCASGEIIWNSESTRKFLQLMLHFKYGDTLQGGAL